ncbi:N-acetylmuramidase family protein [Caldovatus aquaticus]|uniref:N-acetylmuramidase family protein n=1 Tax=Caldovatus aquaticus TaxID=2865671 RepID=A0ABS7F1Z5_9PROT|nr:N-acetylmuramidase family protein [Caldovatus aquaticus]MBW8269641.1 N-acetylmuramidase family protein [Caldovatus aquaticus]
MTPFAGKGLPLTDQGFRTALGLAGLGGDPAADAPRLWAVLQVESAGFGFDARRRPRLLFERHVFRRETGGAYDAEAPDLSHPTPGGHGPAAAQYRRLARALALCARDGRGPEPALRSGSWGLGQVMGFNAEQLGYPSAAAMVAAMRESEDAQLRAVAAFLRRHDLAAALRAGDWRAVARAYNGAGFAQGRYDERLREAHARFVARGVPDLALRQTQAALLYCGFDPRGVDGVPGPGTRRAIRAWRRAVGAGEGETLDAALRERLLRQAGLAALLPARAGPRPRNRYGAASRASAAAGSIRPS